MPLVPVASDLDALFWALAGCGVDQTDSYHRNCTHMDPVDLSLAPIRLMKNASLGNSERAGVGIEAPLDADSE